MRSHRTLPGLSRWLTVAPSDPGVFRRTAGVVAAAIAVVLAGGSIVVVVGPESTLGVTMSQERRAAAALESRLDVLDHVSVSADTLGCPGPTEFLLVDAKGADEASGELFKRAVEAEGWQLDPDPAPSLTADFVRGDLRLSTLPYRLWRPLEGPSRADGVVLPTLEVPAGRTDATLLVLWVTRCPSSWETRPR